MKLSICTFAKNRLEQVKRTLPHTLSILAHEDEIVFVDYSDPQNSGTWAKDNIHDDRIVVIWVPNMKWWHMNHARNCAGVNAKNDILVFMDIDNLPNIHCINAVRNLPPKIWYGAGVGVNISGFAAIRKSDFWSVNGYEEALVGYGYDDTSMHIALGNMGIPRVDLSPDCRPSVIDGEQVRILEPSNGYTWEQNKKITQILGERHPYRVNVGRNWATGWTKTHSDVEQEGAQP